MMLFSIANNMSSVFLGLKNAYLSVLNIGKTYQEWDNNSPRKEKIERVVQITVDVSKVVLVGVGMAVLVEQGLSIVSSKKSNDTDNYIAQTSIEGCGVEQSNQIIGDPNIGLGRPSTSVTTEQVVSNILNSKKG